MAKLNQDVKENKIESVIFVGTGIVWGGKEGGLKKLLCRFNTHHLLETTDSKLIEQLRSLGYDEITHKELERLARDPNTFHKKLMEDYVYKKKVVYVDDKIMKYNEYLRA